MDLGLKQQIESHIMTLPDVLSCRLKTELDEIVELHVLSSFNRHPKQISRDIQSLCFAAYDIDIDHKIISVAQTYPEEPKVDTDEQQTKSVQQQSAYRVNFKGISHRINMLKDAEVAVTITYLEAEKTGVARGVNSKSNNNRMVVDATIDALNQVFDFTCQIVLDEIRTVEISGVKAVLVAICVMSNYKEEIFVGSALMKNNMDECIVKATLDALNRKILQLESK